MKTFYKWLKESFNNITINVDEARNLLLKTGRELAEKAQTRKKEALSFDYDFFLKEITNKFASYPANRNLINALNSKNPNYIMDQYKKLREWINSNRDHSYLNRNKNDLSNEMLTLSRKIWIYLDSIDKDLHNAPEQEVENSVEEMVKKTYANMEEIKSIISQAISRINQWNGSAIVIEATEHYEMNNTVSFDAFVNALIHVGTAGFEGIPSFTFFRHESKIVIDDVLEGGDEDFFKDSKTQSDYFNLIQELRNPGQSGKGKLITLYTARPKTDREQILSSNRFPVNIFMVNNLNHAEGLAIDLAGSGEKRDIWKVRIDSKYLNQTLDGPIKYYQLTTDNAPMKMDLISF